MEGRGVLIKSFDSGHEPNIFRTQHNAYANTRDTDGKSMNPDRCRIIFKLISAMHGCLYGRTKYSERKKMHTKTARWPGPVGRMLPTGQVNRTNGTPAN